MGRGCSSAMTKLFGFDTENDRDLVFNYPDITIYLDKSQTMFLIDTTLDYYSDGVEEGFIFLDKSVP